MSPNGATKHQAKNYKVEGKNRKSLHQKQLRQSEVDADQKVKTTSQQKPSSSSDSKSSRSPSNQSGSSSSSPNNLENGLKSNTGSPQICSSLCDFSRRAQELKADIKKSLDKQLDHQVIDQPIEVIELKSKILKLSQTEAETESSVEDAQTDSAIKDQKDEPISSSTDLESAKESKCVSDVAAKQAQIINKESSQESLLTETNPLSTGSQDERQADSKSGRITGDNQPGKCQSETVSSGVVQSPSKGSSMTESKTPPEKLRVGSVKVGGSDWERKLDDALSPLDMDGWSIDVKKDTIVSNLLSSFQDQPLLIKSLCHRLVLTNEHWRHSMSTLHKEIDDGKKLERANVKLKELCRELQKSNNAIRIESLDLIKVEQGKAKEQTTKIQSTLSGVIKLFDENQQRNMILRQENHELQVKLKSLLEHCDSWEKSVEIALRQREIDNRLLKTELAKANLTKNEEKEKFLNEKQELLQILSIMQEQQHRIEGQEAKLRSDLSSYASKYDECQAVISKGMDKFQLESKRMLKQIERSKQDYKVLLTKYESTNRKMAQLLEEKQYWDKAMSIANRKVETLEKLCRALRDQKPEDRLSSDNAGRATKKPHDRSKMKAKEKEPSSHSESVHLAEVKKGLETSGEVTDTVSSCLRPLNELVVDVEESGSSRDVCIAPQSEIINTADCPVQDSLERSPEAILLERK